MTLRQNPFAIALAAVALTASLAGSSRLEAADISDLANEYSGDAYDIRDTANEEGSLKISNIVKSGGGKFTADLGFIPLSGKVTNTGKVTLAGKFKGVQSNVQINLKVKATGQLSATGRFLVGSIVITGSAGGETINDKSIFSIQSPQNP